MDEGRTESVDRGLTKAPTWPSIFAELVLLGVVSVVLAVVASRMPSGVADVGFLFVLVLGLHGCASMLACRRVADFLLLECPTCLKDYHGIPERWPRPLRDGCAHCGTRLD